MHMLRLDAHERPVPYSPLAASRSSTVQRSGFSWADASMASRRRSGEDAEAIRVLLVDHDQRFVEQVRRRLVGTAIDLSTLPSESGIDMAVAERRPQVLLLAQDREAGAGQLARMPAFKRRHPSVGVVMISDADRVSVVEAARAHDWGTLGIVPRSRLLRGRTLPEMIRTVARQVAGAPSNGGRT